MIKHSIAWFSGLAALLLFLPLPIEAAESASLFAFVNPQYLMTAEVDPPHAFVVNFINLSDFVVVVQPNEFIYKGASGRFYIGQVYQKEQKDNRGEIFRYSASILLKGRSFTGLNIVGAFHELDHIEELSVRIGAKRYYFQPMDKVQFDQLAAKVGGLDLQNPSPRAALQDANIAELGTVKSTDGTSAWDQDWQGLIRPDGVNPPKVIDRIEIYPTDEARRKGTYGKIRLVAVIDKNGEVRDAKIEKGLGRGLDERTLKAVKESWAFLPATRNGEVVESTIYLDIDFPPPAKK